MKKPKSILIVGAEKGLGLGLVNEFLKRSYMVTGTSRPGADASALEEARQRYPEQLNIGWVDINLPASVDDFAASLSSEEFDITFYNAGIFGPLHQSLLDVTDDEVTSLFLTNAISPVRLAKKLIGHLPRQGGMIAFMTSHRASITNNTEGAVELYSASKAALNQLTRSLYFYAKPLGHTVLNVHPGWVNTDMGTLNGTVSYEIELDESVTGVANVVEAHFGSGEHVYVDYQDNHLPW